ncbi:uncharacterized protein LOC107820480 [Nicotiana tabacum]|uniref:Uncharacterized protein LOC107820480 n=2 Tax=Nicotiana TaxID=4085 RepID=A0A1S4CMH3_TOBAC|nr:PREDICTED: uncharacterized protein LOC104242454 isoform X2 [Nicotiana sylvestris]XP_009795809.1 PREDICTED: uncharacterized protein LOC104242454 isoform X2 [Nicotiana sylvestris]XP_016502256.1 PREDICTED: uncharacterized protein LOC107820480 [Nicotiana tabacum]
MAMGPERSKPPLHNFTLPCGLKWGNQKFLRCAKVESDGQISAIHRRSFGSELIGRRRSNDRKFRPPEKQDAGEGIGAVREKLMFDLQTEADKIKDAIFREGLEEQQLSPAPAKTATAAVSYAGELSRPWNLRTRRAACKEPNGFVAGAGAAGSGGGGSKGGLKIDAYRTNAPSPLRTENKSPTLRSDFAGGAAAGASASGEKRQRVKFSVPLSRGEIEEDFMAMVGHRPPRRPKKRAKFVQKNLDTLFPGLWLTEITPDLYKVPEDQ